MLLKYDTLYLYRIEYIKIFFMAASKPKKVKLQPKHRALVYGQKVVPWLSVSGIWLAQAGFHSSQSLRFRDSAQTQTVR